MKLNEVVIVSAARLPIGRFGGSLRDVSDWDMGTIVIAEAMKRAGLKGDEVDEVIMAHGFRTGDLPANSSRAVALKAGIRLKSLNLRLIRHAGEVSGLSVWLPSSSRLEKAISSLPEEWKA